MLSNFFQLSLFTEKPELDSNVLKKLWYDLIDGYFPQRQDLKNYRLVWSGKRQTRSLASCSVHKRTIRVAKAMALPSSRPYLEALIYHELCYAVLGPPKIVRGRRIMHGKDFKALERRHPNIKYLDDWINAGGWDRAVRKVA